MNWIGPIAAAVAALAFGCDGATQDIDARLAALPHVPAHPRTLAFPPELRGLTFRAVAQMDGAAPGDATMARERACIANFEQWMSAAGWTVVRDPAAPVDLVIEEYCVAGLSTTPHGNLLEIRHAETQTVAIVVERDGAPLVTVSRGPADYVCESSGTPRQIFHDCTTRAELWAQAQIIETLVASQPLAQLARQLAGTR